jgi:hypothetical protein
LIVDISSSLNHTQWARIVPSLSIPYRSYTSVYDPHSGNARSVSVISVRFSERWVWICTSASEAMSPPSAAIRSDVHDRAKRGVITGCTSGVREVFGERERI